MGLFTSSVMNSTELVIRWFSVAVLATAGIVTAFNLTSSYQLDIIFILCAVWALYSNRGILNVTSLLVILITFRAVEFLILQIGEVRNAYLFYPTQMAIDAAALYLFANRNKILRKIEYRKTGNIDVDKYIYTNGDRIMAWIYTAYLVLAVLGMTEHLIRHPDDILLPFDKNPHIRYVYDSWEYIKGALNCIEIAAILATAESLTKDYMRQGRLLNA